MPKTGKLYVVATPIGNLGDISIRALDVLKSVDYVLCEDSRVTKKLLNKYKISVPCISYHQHSDEKKIKQIKELIGKGKELGLVTDAGTPGISDPGNYLISKIVEEFSDLEIIAIPGASALIAALSISGFPTDKFIFLGFPPHKNKRNKFFQEVKDSKHTVVFYESCHRIKKTLDQLEEVLDSKSEVCIARELTKKFESIYRGSIKDILEMNIPAKGEFVIVVRNN